MKRKYSGTTVTDRLDIKTLKSLIPYLAALSYEKKIQCYHDNQLA